MDGLKSCFKVAIEFQNQPSVNTDTFDNHTWYSFSAASTIFINSFAVCTSF